MPDGVSPKGINHQLELSRKVLRILVFQTLRNDLQVGGGSFPPDARLEVPNSPDFVFVGIGAGSGHDATSRHVKRHPNFTATKSETRRHDPDKRYGFAVERQRRPNDFRISVE